MLRAILRRHIADHNCGTNDQHYITIDFANDEIEAALSRGGSGPMGFDATSLVGIEVLVQDSKEAPNNGSDVSVDTPS